MHKRCSTSKTRDNSSENKISVSSCLLCDSRVVDGNHNKRFDLTKSEVLNFGTCDGNSNYCDFFSTVERDSAEVVYFFSNCVYHNFTSLNNEVKHKRDDLFIMHFNVRSLQKNVDKLTTILADFSETPDIIAISETKITYGQLLVNVDIVGYDLIRCNSVTRAGGVGFYIKQNLTYKLRSDVNVKLDFDENMWIEVKISNGSIVIGVIYRHPTTLAHDYECFTTNLCDIFAELHASNTPFYAVGDYNIDLMQINSNQNIRKYVNEILSTSTKCVIDLPTRVIDHSKTLLDHIYVNDPKYPYTNGVFVCDLSDHMATFVCISTKKACVKTSKQYLIRDMRNFNLEKFITALGNDLTAASLGSISSAHDAFDKFEKVLCSVVN